MSLAFLMLLVYSTCSLIGYVVALLLPKGPWTPYVQVVVSYHLFLGCAVLYRIHMEQQKVGISVSIPGTIFTHVLFVALAFGIESIPATIMRSQSQDYGIGFVLTATGLTMRAVTCLVALLAYFEVNTLFSRMKSTKVTMAPPESSYIPVDSNQEHDEFLAYLKGPKRTHQKPGRGLPEEFEAWRADQAKKRAAEAKTVNQ